MVSVHRLALGVILLGNAVAFAGVDPPARLATAAVVLLLMFDLRRVPDVPRLHRLAGFIIAALILIQLAPLPELLRRLIQPGFADVMASGWYPLSLAPWATIHVAASAVIVVGIALTAARIGVTRSGLPVLLALITATGVVVAVLGLAGEAGAPEKVLLVRDNTGGGSPYGPFVNENHFAQAVELTLPAALVLLAVSARKLRGSSGERQLAAVMVLGSSVATVVTVAAMLRSGSRGGALFLLLALALTFPLWLRPLRFRGRRWPAVVAGVVLVAVVGGLSWTRLPELEEGFRDLVAVEGVDGNTRWDLWAGTVRSWQRSPVVGSGLGSYRYVIGLDKPATGSVGPRTGPQRLARVGINDGNHRCGRVGVVPGGGGDGTRAPAGATAQIRVSLRTRRNRPGAGGHRYPRGHRLWSPDASQPLSPRDLDRDDLGSGRPGPGSAG